MNKLIIKLHFKNYYFCTSFLPSLIFISLFILLISLGVWQINRGNQKNRLQTQYSEQQRTRPMFVNQMNKINGDKIYSPAIAEGRFDNKQNFFLDNKIYQHRVGYEILTPFILKNSNRIILVNRGWVPQGPDRETLPFIEPITENIIIEGLIVLPKKTFSFKKITDIKRPQRIQTVTLEFLNKKHLQPFIFTLNKQAPYSFVPLWQPIILPPKRHYAYAFQWFALSITLLFAFIISHLTHI